MPRVIDPAGLLLALCVAFAPVPVVADGGDAAAPDRVAVLPLLDAGGARPEAKDDYREAAVAEIEARCRLASIPLAGREEVTAALADLRLATADAEDRTKSALLALSERLHSRYILTGVIEAAIRVGRYRGPFSDQRETGHARVRLRVFDATTGAFVEAWEWVGAARARDDSFPVTRSRGLRCRAVRDATRDALSRFLTAGPHVPAREAGGAARRQADGRSQ